MRYLSGYFTSTVGLVTARSGDRTNVMAAEWSYLVAKRPAFVAIVMSDGSLTRELIGIAGEFAVTLCAEDQAALADFAGSVSGRDIDKTATSLLTLCAPSVISTCWVGGGLLALECAVRDAVPLPGYRMIIGEVLAVHLNEGARPLVKHGGMYRLGERIDSARVVAAAEFREDGRVVIRVAASAPGARPGAPWRVELVAGGGRAVPLGEIAPAGHGDLLADFVPPPELAADVPDCKIRVTRDGAVAGWSRIRVGYGRAESSVTVPLVASIRVAPPEVA